MKSFSKILVLFLSMLFPDTSFGDDSSLPVQGYIIDITTDKPLDGQYDVTFNLYDSCDDDNTFFSETQNLEFEEGIYNTYIVIDTTSFQMIQNTQTLCLSIQIGDDEELLPRTEYHTTPYALFARVSTTSLQADVATVALSIANDNLPTFLGDISGSGLKVSGTTIKLDTSAAQTWTGTQTYSNLVLPQATDVSATTAEGQISWDTDNDTLYIGDGTTAVAVTNPFGNSIESSEITNGTITVTDLNATLTFSDADFIDLSAILHNDTASQGLKLPNVGSSPTDPTDTGEGYIAWDETNNLLLGNTGSAWISLSTTIGNTVESSEITDGTVDISVDTNFIAGRSLTLTGSTVDADTELYTEIKSFYLKAPTVNDDDLVQLKFASNVTITRISCSTNRGTITIQFDEGSETTPNTAGTDVMSADLVCDTDTQVTTTFSNAAIAANALLSMDIDVVIGGATKLRVHVEYTKDD